MVLLWWRDQHSLAIFRDTAQMAWIEVRPLAFSRSYWALKGEFRSCGNDNLRQVLRQAPC